MEGSNTSTLKATNKPRRSPVSDISRQLGKLPPQAIELEEAVLGALMLERDALTNVIEVLKPQSFYKDAHRMIFEAIVKLFNNSEPVDIKTVVHQLRKNGHLELVGGAYYVSELTTKVNSAANIEYHARIIAEQSIKRDLIQISSDIQHDAYEDTTDVFDLLDKAQQSLFDVSESHIRKNFDNMSALMHQAIQEIEERKNQSDGLTGIPSGFTALDRNTSGWQRSDLIIIAARPGMGKTAFVVSALRNAAVDFNIPVAIFSLEMSSVQLVHRMVSGEAELESDKLRKGNLEAYEWQQLISKTSKLSEAPIFIDDTPGLSILELRAKARRLVAQHGVSIIVIDYLQLMSGESSNNGGNREQEIAQISRSLKMIAKELNVPVIALSQLSRAVETRGGDKRPQLSDLRESGSIEQDADMVMFLYRPEYYGITQDENGMPMQGTGIVIIAKNRHGKLEDVPLKFIGKFTKFEDLDQPMGGDNYGQTFPQTGGGGNTDFTITLPSKANKNEGGGGGDDAMPF
ncbi:replicative DNA helicase [Marinoscillum furvescens]|uniref:Replicative DNA helicase n=1 Tax=Marinoscillum furvescens DSM 4134 TaxID=1122208 RepID=A0A3D9L727_MARFU|nr:replicative DNA helicase [Marinoscillum furvescens]REE02148.1 primary replicative DNA helicase [Marinoscillum furvescens DSM 4134]